MELITAIENNNIEKALSVIEAGCLLDIQDKDGCTAIMYACQNKLEQVAFKLIEAKCSLDIQDKNGETTLMYACRHKFEQAVIRLIESGCDIDKVDYRGKTAIDMAKEKEMIKMIQRIQKRYELKIEEGITIIRKGWV